MDSKQEMKNAVPVRHWGLDPLYWAHIKLFVKDVLELNNYPGFKEVYAISNHPINQVEIVGRIVMMERKEMLTNYGVDDGTGCVSCCVWRSQNREMDMVEATFGDIVRVVGKITKFREKRQITVSTFHIETDPNVEPFHWLKVMQLREIYEKPFEAPRNSKTPTVSKPWLKTNLDKEIDRLEELLKDTIIKHLKAKGALSFPLDSLFEVARVTEIMEQLTIKYNEKQNKGKTAEQVREYLKDNLRNLEKDGVVYCKPILNAGYREYNFLSIEKDLSPRIIQLIREISRSRGESSSGVSLNQIVTSLKSLDKYKSVPFARVKLAVGHLMTNSHIYETSREHYRFV